MDVYGLVGNPVGHSLSPSMHEAAYEALDIDARYVTFEPEPDDIAGAVAGAKTLGVCGLNVTIPFKRDVLEVVNPDPLADRIGAVNTIDLVGEATGYNTDAIGATRALREHDVELSGEAVVVGAGGAGRAVAFGLADEEMRVRIANRTVERAHDLASDVPNASGHPLDALPELLPDTDVLVNATSVGMGAPDESLVPPGALHANLAVLDAVYEPLETKLLRDARAAGATTVDGAWMLLYQGVEAFEIWTGRDAPVDEMNDALRAHL